MQDRVTGTLHSYEKDSKIYFYDKKLSKDLKNNSHHILKCVK